MNIKSPCINICKIDPHTECCIGCKRYIEEIENWLYLTDLEKRSILARLNGDKDEKAKKE